MSNVIKFPIKSGTPNHNRLVVAVLRRKPALPLALAKGGVK